MQEAAVLLLSIYETITLDSSSGTTMDDDVNFYF